MKGTRPISQKEGGKKRFGPKERLREVTETEKVTMQINFKIMEVSSIMLLFISCSFNPSEGDVFRKEERERERELVSATSRK